MKNTAFDKIELGQIQDIFEKALSMNEDKEMSIKKICLGKKLLEINVNFMVGIIVEKKGQRVTNYIGKRCGRDNKNYHGNVRYRMWLEGKENTFSKGYINVGSMRGGIILCGRERFNIRREVRI
ncbi:hypothetical protein CWI37_0354p0010 [Hamiltosporidium tvaerminnensis]|uniref:Uncharacterized protein n=1 Tax=Hamiltosporidium tvaerminnensis TaxID=1176355 RepID=A0A4Q9L6G4_9MICR|nr:hypothetical protein CWI37_0354p0010 [Hamiltosporidium tvaerminnensis]